MNPVEIIIIGGGWRTEFFLRVSRELPERFRVGGALVRDPEKGRAFAVKWNVPTYRTLDELLSKTSPKYAVVSVPWKVTPVMVEELANRGIPALAETPPAPDLEGLIAINKLTERGAKVQVAEQYAFQPLNAARLAVAHSGLLDTISEAQVSIAHGYHGISLMRKFLGITYENATIQARSFTSPLVASPNRNGPPAEERIVESKQTIAWIDFGDKFGVFDFTGDQYFSWIRTNRLLVRGTRGEINNTQIKYLKDYKTPITIDLLRQSAGVDVNFEGYYLRGYLAGSDWVYTNPFIPARLSDDEIAVATCMEKMAQYTDGGPDFYPLAEASQDHYLSMMIDKAITTNEPVKTETQSWAE